jgi:arylsulfatase A-like enzyme
LTLPEALRRAGYATAACGKIHFEPQQAYLPQRQELSDGARGLVPRLEAPELPYYGFTDVHCSENLLGEAYVDFIEREAPDMLDRVLSRRGVPEAIHELTWITDRAVDFVRRQSRAGTPFFLHCSFHELSPPCTPPAGFEGITDPDSVRLPPLRQDDLDAKPDWYRRCYEGYVSRGIQPDASRLRLAIASCHDQMRFIDRQFGRLLQVLDDLGIRDDTVVLYTADHGLSLNDHWQWRHGPFLFDEVIRVPMIWHVPGTSCGGHRAEALVEQVDIMPTVLDLCGAERPPGLQGQSLTPVFDAPETPGDRDSVLIQERHAPDLRVRGVDPSGITQVGLRTREWKLISYVGLRDGELYNLDDDPGEFRNLWGEPGCAGRRAELEALLRDRLYATSPFPPCPYAW